MSIERQHLFFDMVAKEIVDDFPGTAYTIIALQDSGYRVMIEHGKIKKGFAVPFKTSTKDFTKIFSEKIDEIKKIKSDIRIAGGL